MAEIKSQEDYTLWLELGEGIVGHVVISICI